MNDTANHDIKTFRFPDFLVILICLSVAAANLYLFRDDLNRTLNSMNQQPVGTIIVKNNIVQRRFADRVLWDRLFVESPVYSGDVIRVAELSAATLNFDNNEIDIDENTLIRIQRSPNSNEPVKIELTQGSLALRIWDGEISLNVMGNKINAGPGTVLIAKAGEEGSKVQVTKGSAAFRSNEVSREISEGTMLAVSNDGKELNTPAVVMNIPGPGAHFLKSGNKPVIVPFSWNRINMKTSDVLRLEISIDKNFTQAVKNLGNLYDRAEAALGTGAWNWRLFLADTVIANGRVHVLEASGPALLSPANDSVIRVQANPPQIRFQWMDVPEVSHYVVEASETPGFTNPKIKKETSVTSYTDSSLNTGTWYWRVMPVFPASYEGSAAFSTAFAFRIEQGEKPEEPEWITPLPPEPVEKPVVAEAPPPPPPPPPSVRPAAPAARPAARPATPAPTPQVPTPTPAAPVTPVPIAQASAPPQATPLPPAAPVTPAPITQPSASPPAAPAQAPQVTPAPPPAAPTPPPPLARPANRLPASGHRIGIDDLRVKRSIDFLWSPVPQANGYILSIYQETPGGRRLVLTQNLGNRSSWTLENISALDRGNFVWQVEAIIRNSNGTVERHGIAGENSFVIDIPVPSEPSVQIRQEEY